MSELRELCVDPAVAETLPPWSEVLAHLRSRPWPTPAEVLGEAAKRGRPFVQPRCGVGDHQAMLDLLRGLEQRARPGLLSVTIDSHTRLGQFGTAARTLAEWPANLNGYPLVAHGWQRGRELTEAVSAPLEVRHGSPDARTLFAVAVAAGMLSFEGGGISYNLPYAKDVPLSDSLAAWRDVDAACGDLAGSGVIIDRELFGTLTAVLVPPSISLTVGILEAAAAAREGVRCVSIAYAQGGEPHQDVAALRAIRGLARRYLPPDVSVHPVLHQFMGPFPRARECAEELILLGALVGRMGPATKIVNKTYEEAHGVPGVEANAAGIRLSAMAQSTLLDDLRLDEARIGEEQEWIEKETTELLEPVLEGPDLYTAIDSAFRNGSLDVPFSASRHARSEVLPKRDRFRAIRYLSAGSLPLSRRTRRRHLQQLEVDGTQPDESLLRGVIADIDYFQDLAHRMETPR